MTIRGWCPDLFTPMPSGDGWLARVKPRGPALSAADLHIVADAAEQYGNGVIELTSRANLQIRGLTEISAKHFATKMVAAGLASPEPAIERRRNILVSPLAGLDRTCAPGTLELAAALATALAKCHELAVLPGKFLFAVDGGGALPLGDCGADIVLRAALGRWFVAIAKVSAETVDPVSDALALARLCGARRMRQHINEFGQPLVGAARPAVANANPIGHFGQYQGVGLRFGTFPARHLAELAGDAPLRLTPWRAVLLQASSAIAGPGLILAPDDPIRRIGACPGRPACASALADVRGDALRLARLFPDGSLHISACAKGCAHPGPADVTLVATGHGYNVIRQGRASDQPTGQVT